MVHFLLSHHLSADDRCQKASHLPALRVTCTRGARARHASGDDVAAGAAQAAPAAAASAAAAALANGGGRAVVLALGGAVAAAFTATAIYPIFIAKERPAQAGERPTPRSPQDSTRGDYVPVLRGEAAFQKKSA